MQRHCSGSLRPLLHPIGKRRILHSGPLGKLRSNHPALAKFLQQRLPPITANYDSSLCIGSQNNSICHRDHSRCFQRHGISRLPDLDGQRPAKKKFKVYPIGYFHVDLTEVRAAEGIRNRGTHFNPGFVGKKVP